MMQMLASFLSQLHGAARVRTPTILQMEATECGAASLGIVLASFGRCVPLEELRELCGVSRDGSNAANILKVARTFGLEADGFRRSTDMVFKGPFPVIVFWDTNHYLVVEGANKERVYLNDPAIGPRTVSHDEFHSSYSGIVLTFKKGPSFEPGGMPPKLLSRLFAEAHTYRNHVGIILSIGILISIPSFLLPGLVGVFVDDILLQKNTLWLTSLLMTMGIAIVFQALLSWIKNITLLRMQMTMALERSASFMWHVLRLPVAFYAVRYQGDIASRVNSVESVARLLTVELGHASINALTAALLLGLMMLLSPLLAIIAIAGALINVFVLRWFRRSRIDYATKLQNEHAKLFSTTVSGLRLIETIKATGAEDAHFGKWAGYHARSINSEQRLARLEEISTILPPLIATMTVAVALGIGGTHVMNGLITLGALLAFQALFSSINAPIQNMVQVAGQAQEAAADLARIDDVLSSRIDPRHLPSTQPDEEDHPSIPGLKLNNISFGYIPLAPPMIEDLNISVKSGGWIALVGGSGSGKSTIGKLICGLYESWDGEVLFDGRPIPSISRLELSRLLATVDQKITLFEGTIRENICLWDDTISHEDLVSSTRDAAILDEILQLPGSFDAIIEENGRNLSGGQRQRIEIARALVRCPAVLVLDEATSALDPTTEFAIIDALRRRGTTCIMIAHRLSTIRDCDEILVLDDGKVVERGTHRELVAMNGTYTDLIGEGDN